MKVLATFALGFLFACGAASAQQSTMSKILGKAAPHHHAFRLSQTNTVGCPPGARKVQCTLSWKCCSSGGKCDDLGNAECN